MIFLVLLNVLLFVCKCFRVELQCVKSFFDFFVYIFIYGKRGFQKKKVYARYTQSGFSDAKLNHPDSSRAFFGSIFQWISNGAFCSSRRGQLAMGAATDVADLLEFSTDFHFWDIF